MAKPYIHADASVRRYGGKSEDYLELHELMDSSKIAHPTNVHRTLTHNTWFAKVIIPKCFGNTITNSDGKKISTEQIALDHIAEDFGGKFVPSAQDYLINVVPQDWFENGKTGLPSSYTNYGRLDRRLQSDKTTTSRTGS